MQIGAEIKDTHALRRAGRRKRELVKLLKDIELNKAALINAVNGLREQYKKGMISCELYNLRSAAILGTRTIPQWMMHYDSYAKDCMTDIDKLDRQIILSGKQKAFHVTPALSYLVFAALIAVLGFFLIKPAFIGFVILENIVGASDELNMTFNQSAEYTWSPSRYGELQSLMISGRVSADGFAVVSIINDNTSYIIFNSSMLEAGGFGDITGYAVFGEDAAAEVDNVAVGDPLVVGERDVPGNVTLDIMMQYKSGTAFDPEDDGRESTGGFIDFTVENSITDQNESHLCAIWNINNIYKECYGSGLCCDFVEVDRYDADWKKPFLAYYGLEGIVLDNNINSQVWYVDYNLSLENPYSYIYSSDIMQLPAKFHYRGYMFEDSCIDTCLVAGLGFNKTNYTLNITIDNAEIEISTLDYTTYVGEIIELIANETLTQHSAEINKPVRWTKKVKYDLSQPGTALNISINAENVSVYKKKGKKFVPVQDINIRINQTDYTEITILEETDEFEVEYYTPAPEIIEENISAQSKKIIVTSEEHYTDILTYTSLPSEARPEFVHLYWVVNDTMIEVPDIAKNDTDNNGLIDWIEWITPHLSNQTYIIEIDINRSSPTFYERSPDTCDATEYVLVDDTQYTYCKKGQYDWWSGYDFSGIPDDANITGIRVELKDAYTKKDKESYSDIRLSWDDRSNWTLAKTSAVINESSLPGGTYVFGSSNDTWGRNWTPDELKNHFWVEWNITGLNPVSADWLPVSVYYTVAIEMPSSVTDLERQSSDNTWIYWNWTNPPEENFMENIIYIDGVWNQNTSNNYYNATNLTPEQNYTITVHTKDIYDYINTEDVNNTATATNATPPIVSNITRVSPSTFIESSSRCSDSLYAYSDDEQYTYCDKNEYDWWNGYDFSSIPDGAIITGIQVELKDTYCSADKISYANISLSWDNRSSWTGEKTSFQIIDTSPPGRTYVFGGSNDTWEHNWTLDEIKNNFWVEWGTVGENAGGVYMDWMPVTIFYTYVPQIGSVANLNNPDAGKTWLYWNWTNPTLGNFSEAVIYLDGVNVLNTSNNYYNATGLMPNTAYTITVHAKDVDGNLNTVDVSSSAITRKIVYLEANASKISPTTFVQSPSKCDASIYAYSYDDLYTYCSEDRYDWWGGYNLSVIPDNAIINGIEVALFDTHTAKNSVSYANISLSWDNMSSWTIPKTSTQINETEFPGGDYTLGGENDTWGRSWTADEIKNYFWVEWKTVGPDAGKVYTDWLPLTIYYSVPTQLPLVSKFTHPDTTNFSAAADLGNIENMTLAVDNTKVTWINAVNATDEDYDVEINMGEGFVSVNVPALDATINTTANVTLENINCSDFRLYYAEGFYQSRFELVSEGNIIADETNLEGNCTDASICADLYCSGNTLNFIAQHFDGFGVGVILGVNATSPAGFGDNVTIDAEIASGNYTIDTVLAGINPPGDDEVNYTMHNISSGIFVLDNYTNYINGTYNYTVYVNNTAGNITSDSGFFDMWINMTLGIMTLKDSYLADEIVNLTSV